MSRAGPETGCSGPASPGVAADFGPAWLTADLGRDPAYAPPLAAPALIATDAVVFGWAPAAGLHVLLVQRGVQPWEGAWALPGGFVQRGEGLRAAALRELEEETGLRLGWMEQLGAFGEPGRDPRGRVVSVAFLALVGMGGDAPAGATDAASAAWVPAASLPPLAFDHAEILTCALARLRHRVAALEPVGLALLPAAFTLAQLQRLHEDILGAPLDKANFRRRLRGWMEGAEPLLEPAAPAAPARRGRGPAPAWYTLRAGVAEALLSRSNQIFLGELP